MALSRRYSPEWSPSDTSTIGMDFSAILPLGVGITSGSIAIFANFATPVDASTDWSRVDPVSVVGRAVYTTLTGGVAGSDYQLRWTVNDTLGNTWTRTGLLLVGLTS